MANWAVVIGINKYRSEQMSLRGAVRDALTMREWLIDPAGGKVPEANVLTALSPRDGEDVRGVEARGASRDDITDLILELIERSGGVGDRLFVYYAGHGLTARVNFSDENALLASDFTVAHSDNSFTLRSLFEYLQTTQFANQFLFIDACRNTPFEHELVPGQWPLPRRRDPGQPPVQQFILYATSPGLTAVEYSHKAGEEQGAFTEVLLKGLHGHGPAKSWCPGTTNYNVRWDGLVNFIMAEMRDRRLQVGQGRDRELFQIPQQDGARGEDPNPVLAEFTKETFEEEKLKLDVLLEPDVVLPVAEVHVIDTDTFEPVETRAQIPGLPVTFELPPRPYGVRAIAPKYEKAVRRPPVELYKDERVTLTLRESAALDEAEPPGAQPAPGGVDQQPGSALAVQAPDELAPVEVADTTGRVLAVSRGGVRLDDLAPGLYRAKLRTPEGAQTEQVIELNPGEKENVVLDAPRPPAPPAVQKLTERGDLQIRDDNAVEVPDVGTVVDPHLSTLLALALSRAIQSREVDDDRLGFKELTDRLPLTAESAVSLLIGVDAETESEADKKLGEMKIRFWRFWQNVPDQVKAPEEFPDLPGTGVFTRSARPGQHWLSIEGVNGKPLVLALALLPNRVTTVVLQIDREGLPEIHQYMPSMDADESSEPAALRRQELIQRIHLGTRLDAGYTIARELLGAKRLDPLAGCLGAYLLLRIGEGHELGHALANLNSSFPELSDVHVITAEYEAERGRSDAAEAAIERAFQVGVPIMGEGLARLLDAVGVYQLNHPAARLVSLMHERHVPRSLWASWTPEALSPGGQLVP